MHSKLPDEWSARDLGGMLYMEDGRVIERKPGQSDVDAILGLPAVPLLTYDRLGFSRLTEADVRYAFRVCGIEWPSC